MSPLMKRSICRWLKGMVHFLGCLLLILSLAYGRDYSEKWKRISCPEMPLEPEDRFETVKGVASFDEDVEGWIVARGSQQAEAELSVDLKTSKSGKACLRSDFSFRGKMPLEYVELASPVRVNEPGLGIGFWVKGGLPKMSLRLRIRDHTGETHQVDLSKLGEDNWQYVAASLDGPGGWWGGDENHRLDFPCQIQSVVADKPSQGFIGHGSLWLDEVALVRPRKRPEVLCVEVWDPPLGLLYPPGERVSFRVSGPGQIQWRVQNFWGDTLSEGKSLNEVTSSLDPPALGFYSCEFECREEGDSVERRALCFGVLPRPMRKANDFVGVCTHYRNGNYPLESMGLLCRYGLRHFRDEVSWSAMEKEKGGLILPEYANAFLDEAERLKRKPLLIFDYGCPWYDDGGYPLSPDAVEAYARYAAVLAEKTFPVVSDFEVWNEYTGGCGMSGKTGQQTPKTYARMLQETYDLVKKRVPGGTIVGIGGDHSAHHFDKIEGMLRAGASNKMDALSVHSYRYPSSPEETDLVGEIQRVGELASQCEAPVRLWITEIGWPTHLGPRGVDEATQARYAVRTLALLQTTGIVERVYWYDFRDDGLKRDYNENNFGLVRHQDHGYAPKPAALSVSSFSRLTSSGMPRELWQEGGCYAAVYELPLGQELWVAWCTQGKTVVQVQGRLKAVKDLFGNELELEADLVLDENPIYLMGKELALTLQTP